MAPLHAEAPFFNEELTRPTYPSVFQASLHNPDLLVFRQRLNRSHPTATSSRRWRPALHLSVLVVDDIHDVDVGAFDDLEQKFVEFESLVVTNLHTLLLVVPLYELVVGLELADALDPEPIPDLHQLGLQRSFLISTQMLNLNVALIAQKLLDLIYRLVVYRVDVGPVLLGRPG